MTNLSYLTLTYLATRIAHSLAYCALLASLARFAAHIRSLAGSLNCSGAHGKETYVCVYELNASIMIVSTHSA